MAAAAHGGEREISIGRVLGRAFSTIVAHPAATLGLAFVFGALPSLIVYAGMPLVLPRFGALWTLVAIFSAGAVNMGFASVLHGMLALTILQREEGRAADIVDTLPPALARLVPLMLVGLIVGFGFTFGLVLLIVPGIILYMMWWVAAPAMVAERLGVVGALRRSAELTDGARWTVFGAELVLGIGTFMVNAALKAAGLSMDTGPFGGAALQLDGGRVVPLLLYVLVQTATLAVYAAAHASFYVELRMWKEGPRSDALVEVFR